MLLDLGLVTGCHVVGPPLCVGLLHFVVLDDHRELRGVNVSQLGTIAVATTNDTLLVVIVVGAREEVTEGEFRVP